MSDESLYIFKPIKISIPDNFLTLWHFFLQFSTFFKMKHYQLFPVISAHVEKQCCSPLRPNFNHHLKKFMTYFISLVMFTVCDVRACPVITSMIIYRYMGNGYSPDVFSGDSLSLSLSLCMCYSHMVLDL